MRKRKEQWGGEEEEKGGDESGLLKRIYVLNRYVPRTSGVEVLCESHIRLFCTKAPTAGKIVNQAVLGICKLKEKTVVQTVK